MSTHDPEFLRQLHAAFQIEATEHLQAISSGLLQLEKAATAEEARPILENTFREAHSLKGAARAVNLPAVEALCQGMESVFADWKRETSPHGPAEFDVIHQALNSVGELVARAQADVTPEPDPRVEVRRQQLDQLHRSAASPDIPVTPPAATTTVAPHSEAADTVAPNGTLPGTGDKPPVAALLPTAETVRISTAKLDALLRQTEEMLAWKLTSSQRLLELRQLQTELDAWERQWVKVDSDLRGLRQALEKQQAESRAGSDPSPVARLLEFLEVSQVTFKSVESKASVLVKCAEHDRRALGGMVDHLLADAKKLVMLPFSTLLAIFPKLVRDLGRDQAKQIELTMQGGEVEIDKRVLEEMKDPLIHLVRNCIDHGLEKPEIRDQQHKPSRGTLTLAICQVDGNKVEIRVGDDGRGIDVSRVRQAAVKNGTISDAQAQQLGEAEALSLIFQSGVSTSPMLTEISGRGLGLAIVREKVERLGGEIFVETELGQGTRFRVLLPLTLATFRGILVRAADQVFVIPTAHVERVLRIPQAEIRPVENRETIVFDGRTLPLVRLEQVLELPPGPTKAVNADFVSTVILGAGEKRVAFAVEAVLQEQEVLVKNLGQLLSRVRNVAGATVLGSGKPVVILNAPDLLKSAAQAGRGPRPTESEAAATLSEHDKSILVVEDSITARMLLKNILESAGYRVKTAVDGMEAWTTLKSDAFQLVVSDIQMPRLNGFDLTAKIRGDRELNELPVILVTGLASREDRERGIDVGANAYIVKRDFDQSNLLEVIRRLI